MSIYGFYGEKHCRWCGKEYQAAKPMGKDGFCSPGCKQAHYRAYKKYVTAKHQVLDPAARSGTAQK